MGFSSGSSSGKASAGGVAGTVMCWAGAFSEVRHSRALIRARLIRPVCALRLMSG